MRNGGVAFVFALWVRGTVVKADDAGDLPGVALVLREHDELRLLRAVWHFRMLTYAIPSAEYDINFRYRMGGFSSGGALRICASRRWSEKFLEAL